jgi:hypothetical protein
MRLIITDAGSVGTLVIGETVAVRNNMRFEVVNTSHA